MRKKKGVRPDKKGNLILLIYPAVTVLLLITTYVLFHDWWRISFTGEETDGRIEAVLFLREEGENTLVTAVDTHLRLTRQNGSVLDLYYEDQEIVRAVEGDRAYEIGEDGEIKFAGDRVGDRGLTAEFRDVLVSKSDRAEWFLLRQKREGHPTSFNRLEKTETATLWRGLPQEFDAFKVDDATGHVIPDDGRDRFTVSELVTRAVFSYENEEALAERRGQMQILYERRLDGDVLDHEINREFIIYNEPYWTTQYPIFVFDAEGETHAIRADIGRHGDPSLAFPLFAEVVVDYLPDSPREALMNGKIAARMPGEQFLNWFSRASEVYLTRWIYPGMFLLGATLLAFVSYVFISMLTRPPTKLPPIPEKNKKEDAASAVTDEKDDDTNTEKDADPDQQDKDEN